jgi:hypothetical protein
MPQPSHFSWSIRIIWRFPMARFLKSSFEFRVLSAYP